MVIAQDLRLELRWNSHDRVLFVCFDGPGAAGSLAYMVRTATATTRAAPFMPAWRRPAVRGLFDHRRIRSEQTISSIRGGTMMRHFILARPISTGPVAARSICMFGRAAGIRLVTPPRCMQRQATRMGGAVSTVDVAPIAIAADERLDPTVWVRAQEQPRMRQAIMAATAALVMRPQMVWTRATVAAKMPLQSCPCTV